MMDSRNNIPARGRYASSLERRLAMAQSSRAVPAGSMDGGSLRGVRRNGTDPDEMQNGGTESGDGDVMPIRENGPETAGSCSGNLLAGFPLAMVYAPDQTWEKVYDDETALTNGTLFPGLYFPFCPGCRR